MFYHFLVPEGGHPTWDENCFEIKYQNTRSFLKATPVNLKSVATYSCILNMIFFPVCLLLTNHETLYNIIIVLSFHPSCEPITPPFIINGLCPKDLTLVR